LFFTWRELRLCPLKIQIWLLIQWVFSDIHDRVEFELAIPVFELPKTAYDWTDTVINFIELNEFYSPLIWATTFIFRYVWPWVADSKGSWKTLRLATGERWLVGSTSGWFVECWAQKLGMIGEEREEDKALGKQGQYEDSSLLMNGRLTTAFWRHGEKNKNRANASFISGRFKNMGVNTWGGKEEQDLFKQGASKILTSRLT
jgi:hypothetical protein